MSEVEFVNHSRRIVCTPPIQKLGFDSQVFSTRVRRLLVGAVRGSAVPRIWSLVGAGATAVLTWVLRYKFTSVPLHENGLHQTPNVETWP